jgi:hypothetical protein
MNEKKERRHETKPSAVHPRGWENGPYFLREQVNKTKTVKRSENGRKKEKEKSKLGR